MPVPIGSLKSKMLRSNTQVQHFPKYRLHVKREDMSCLPPGPPFSKARGVFAHIQKREEKIIGVLDTGHSQAGWAVARACQILGKKCVNFYPVYKAEKDDNDPPQHELRHAQLQSQKLGAKLHPLDAGRSCILFNYAKKHCEKIGAYLMPNALKLDESVEETAKEVKYNGILYKQVIIPVSSGTIAAGVIQGFAIDIDGEFPTFILHLGYSRSHDEVKRYVAGKAGVDLGDLTLEIVDEGYSYKDKATPGITPGWPCNKYYDLKAFRWWIKNQSKYSGNTLFWNIG